MPRFVAIDGLRAWMAWLVVFTHIVEQSSPGGLSEWWIELDLGGQAVYTFIIISGFVITHLLVERPTRYRAYIIPRFMRLFPALLVSCAAGIAAYAIAADIAQPSWFGALHGRGHTALTDHFAAHLLLHLTMLHGAVSNAVLDNAQYAFVPPAWSVSLEWQFYLVAPFAIWLCRSRGRAVALVVLVGVLSVAYHHAFKSGWERPSFLPGSAKWFLIGIACRLAAPWLAGRVGYAAAVGCGLGFTLLWLGSPALAIWLIVYSFILRDTSEQRGLEGLYVSTARLMLESRPMLVLAERSYSTYLLHWPIIMIVGAVATASNVPPGWQLGAVLCLAVPITLALQEPVYRFVELPGRTLGRRWAKRFGATAVTEVPTETVGARTGR